MFLVFFLFSKLFAAKNVAARKPARTRIQLEALETRYAPAVLTVTSPLDDGGPGTLRVLMNQANLDSSRGISDTIQLHGFSTPGHPVAPSVELTRGPLEVTAGRGGASVTVQASDIFYLFSDANGSFNTGKVFQVDKGAVLAINDLRFGESYGAAISGAGTVKLRHDQFDSVFLTPHP